MSQDDVTEKVVTQTERTLEDAITYRIADELIASQYVNGPDASVVLALAHECYLKIADLLPAVPAAAVAQRDGEPAGSTEGGRLQGVTGPDEFGSMYVRLHPMADGCVKQTRQIQANADYDAGRNLLGVEILNAHAVAPPPIAQPAGLDGWIMVETALPRHGQLIEGRNGEGRVWKETWDSSEPIGLTTCWRPAKSDYEDQPVVVADRLVERLREAISKIDHEVRDNMLSVDYDSTCAYDDWKEAHRICDEIADIIEKLVDDNEAAAALERPAGYCAWVQQDDDDSVLWETSCGMSWCINDGSPSENNMKFCHGCGKPIDQQPFKYELDPDDEPIIAHPSPERSGGVE